MEHFQATFLGRAHEQTIFFEQPDVLLLVHGAVQCGLLAGNHQVTVGDAVILAIFVGHALILVLLVAFTGELSSPEGLVPLVL